MNRSIPSHSANIALAVGVAAAMGIAVALAVTHPVHRLHQLRGGAMPSGEPADTAAISWPPARGEPNFSMTGLRANSDLPFEPPPPPLEQTAATRAPELDRQIAALPSADAAADEVAPSAPVFTPKKDAQIAIPDHRLTRPAPAGRRTAVAEPSVSAGGAAKPDGEPGGVTLAGPAIVTGPLELNIDGRPLELYGVKAPTADDVCSPGDGYAARDCRDVSRQALAARIGLDGDVNCRILAVGGRSVLPAVCTDRKGGDVATYLVAHGFALAEPNEIVDYSGAQARAKDMRAGLWSYR